LPTVNIATAVVFAAGVLGAIALLMWPVRALIRMWLRRASDRIDRLIAQLDAGVDDCSSHRHIARAVRFAASLRLFSPEHPRWAAYLPGWTARLFRSVSGAPAAAADVTLHAAALGDSVGDALIAEFRALPPELRKAIHRSMVARAFPAAAHQQILRILAATADSVESSSGLSSGPVSDYGPIVEYLHYCMKVSENEQGYPSRLFGAMSLSGMGKALLLAMQRKDQRARFGFVTQWATLIAWTGVPAAVGTSRTETPLFLAICTPGYALVLCGLLLVMGAFLGIVAFTHMLIGRPHDPFGLSLRAHGLTAAEHRQLVSERMREPDFSFAHFWGMVPGLRNASFHIRAGWLTRPFANRHIRETVLAQKYMRDEPIDSEFFVSFPKRSVQDVLWKLLKRGYLAPKTIVYLMDDRQLLNRMRKAKPKSVPAPDPSRDDRQLASVLPLHPAAYFFSIAVLAVAMSLLWWSLVWWKLPWSLMSIDQQFWVLSVPYGALPAVVVALLIAAAQSAYVLIPDKAWPQTLLRQSPQRRAVVYQVVLAGASFFALSWATQMMREAAARAGWLTPTNVSNDAFWLIFVVIWISALLAPVMLAQWRNSTLFYPSAADVWRKRAMSTLVVAALLVCLAGVGRMIILESIDSESSASYRKANELYGKREYDGALAKLDNALRFNAGNVDAYLLRCSVYAHKARDEEAATDCSEAMRRDSVAARKYSGVAERRGREAYSKKAYDEAIVELNTALLLDPESASAFLMRCSAHSGKDNLAEAIRDCTSATTRDPKLANAYGRLGWFYLLVSNPTQAIIASQRGLELEKDAAWMRTNLAHGFLFAHQYEAARAVYIDNKDVVLGAGQAFAQAVLDDFKEFRRRKIVPSDVEPDMAKIEALLTAGKSG
jgi:tetratricopeptide (TPR) repeat protein